MDMVNRMLSNCPRKIGKRHIHGQAVSLFSGCGGSDSGAIAAGFDVIFANDIMPYSRDVYLSNLPETDYQCKNIENVESFPQADLLIGCYPCQGFSQGGARESNRAVNYLYRQFRRALRIIRPKAFIVENVSGMYRSNFNRLLNNQLVCFRTAGYLVSHKMLNAADYGVAQDRRRIFIVGIRSDFKVRYRFPDPTHGVSEEEPIKTIADALDGFPEWPTGKFLEQDFHWYYMSRNRRRDWSEPSKTIVSNARHMPLHPMTPMPIRIRHNEWRWLGKDKDIPKRRFSYEEAARLQGFHNDFVFPENGTLMAKYKVVGNAVPPPMFEAVVNALPNVW